MKPSSRAKSLVVGLSADDQLERFVKKFCSLKLREIFNYEVLGKIFASQISKSGPRLRRISGKPAKKSKHEDAHVAGSMAKHVFEGGNSTCQKRQIRRGRKVQNNAQIG